MATDRLYTTERVREALDRYLDARHAARTAADRFELAEITLEGAITNATRLCPGDGDDPVELICGKHLVTLHPDDVRPNLDVRTIEVLP